MEFHGERKRDHERERECDLYVKGNAIIYISYISFAFVVSSLVREMRLRYRVSPFRELY